MTRLMTAALAATVLGGGMLVSAPASANQHGYTGHMPQGFYLGGTIGRLAPRDVDGNVGGLPATTSFDNAWHFGGQAGYRFGNGFRVEGDVNYARTGFDGMTIGGTPTGSMDRDIDIWSFTIGGYYDLNTGTFFRPYAGAGVGAAYQKFRGGTAMVGGQQVSVSSSSSTDFTAFGEVGVGLQVANNLEIVPSYRYQWIDNGANGFDDTTAHIARLGVRFGF